MRMYDVIMNKRKGNELSKEEIDFVVNGFTKGDIPDYQVSALLMAIFFNKMNKRETADTSRSVFRVQPFPLIHPQDILLPEVCNKKYPQVQ